MKQFAISGCNARLIILALCIGCIPAVNAAQSPAERTDPFVELALACVHQEFPNVLLHSLSSEADVRRPRELYPAFYGCYDWHSAVHGHWLLARAARTQSPLRQAALAALELSITPEHIAAELSYMASRPAFERPYGLAWLLQLTAELHEWDTPAARTLADTLDPLARQAVAHLRTWLPKLTHPVRSGTHGQTAFALGLIRDYAVSTGNEALREEIDQHSLRLYAADTDCPLHYEPSGHDFLSHCLGTADLLRRVMPQDAFAAWLIRFLPDGIGALAPARVSDHTDGHLVHLAGLNLSRAWMLRNIANALPASTHKHRALRDAMRSASNAHRKAGLADLEHLHYAGSHWLGTFAMYLETDRGN